MVGKRAGCGRYRDVVSSWLVLNKTGIDSRGGRGT